jgi:hypothetical protein
MEVGVGGELLHVVGKGGEGAEPKRNLGSVAASFKYTPGRYQRAFAITSGAGGGWSPAGTSFGADLGGVVGFENPWVTPFLNGRVAYGLPVTRREINLGECDAVDCSGDLETTARMSLAELLGVGLKIAFPEFLARRTWVGTRILAGAQLAWIHDIDPHEPPHGLDRYEFFMSYGVGFEITLGRVAQWPRGWKTEYPGMWPRP